VKIPAAVKETVSWPFEELEQVKVTVKSKAITKAMTKCW